MKLCFSLFYMNLLVDVFTSNNSETKHLENARWIQMNGGTDHLIEPHIIKNTNTNKHVVTTWQEARLKSYVVCNEK